MILIPEIKTVVILTPRTGSGSMYRSIAKHYPKAMMLYRHMEADGVPHGYDRWPKVGVVRHPVDRLWSLYKFMKNPRFYNNGSWETTYVSQLRESVSVPFPEWLVNNQLVFTHPYDCGGKGRFFPEYTCLHPIPENRKSQFLYLRPDLGTVVYPYERINSLLKRLDIEVDANHNETPKEIIPELSKDVLALLQQHMAWDFEQYISKETYYG